MTLARRLLAALRDRRTEFSVVCQYFQKRSLFQSRRSIQDRTATGAALSGRTHARTGLKAQRTKPQTVAHSHTSTERTAAPAETVAREYTHVCAESAPDTTCGFPLLPCWWHTLSQDHQPKRTHKQAHLTQTHMHRSSTRFALHPNGILRHGELEVVTSLSLAGPMPAESHHAHLGKYGTRHSSWQRGHRLFDSCGKASEPTHHISVLAGRKGRRPAEPPNR